MVFEVRIYAVKPGMMQQWVEFMNKTVVPFQEARGIRVHGQFIAQDRENTFVWIRSFPSTEERDRIYKAVYESAQWKEEIGPKARSHLDKTEFILMTPTPQSRMQ